MLSPYREYVDIAYSGAIADCSCYQDIAPLGLLLTLVALPRYRPFGAVVMYLRWLLYQDIAPLGLFDTTILDNAPIPQSWLHLR